MKALVIGAGCAGLAAAHTIIKNGGTAVLLEKESVAGGRMQNYKKDGFFFDLGAQYVHPGYKVARSLMSDVGIRDQLVDIKMNNIQMYRDGKWAFANFYGSFADKIRTLQWQMKFGLKGLKNIKRLVDFVIARSKTIYEADVDWFSDLENEYFANFVKREYGENVLEYFVQPVLGAITLTYPEKIGMGFGLQIMWTILCGEAAVLKYGTGSLAESLIAECTGDSRILTETPAKRIVIESKKVKGVETDKGFIEADTVICAATATKTLDVAPDMPDPIKQALAKVVYVPTINVVVAVDKVMSAKGSAGGALPRKAGYPISAILFNSARSKSLVPDGCDSINTFVYGDRCEEIMKMSDKEISQTVIEYLQDVLPDMPKKVLFSKVARWPEANYIMPPGCCTAIKEMRDNHYRDVEGLFLCGEYMYTGSYESALASGVAAAEASLGKRKTI
jgi:oxygen-dependent protoporphyrinogen oxidase